jgi:bifunctional DNase/RNase
VRVTEVRDNIFYAELVLDRDTRVSARVSDAVALALHLGIPIHAEDTVLAAAAVTTRSLVSGTILRRWTRSSSSAGSSTPPPRRTSTQSG